MKRIYKTRGVCSDRIEFHLENGRIKDLAFHSGCSGNLQAIGILAEGMEASEVVRLLRGIRCGRKSTSCADQLALAIDEAMKDG